MQTLILKTHTTELAKTYYFKSSKESLKYKDYLVPTHSERFKIAECFILHMKDGLTNITPEIRMNIAKRNITKKINAKMH